MNKRTKNNTIQVITSDNIVRNYYLQIPYSSGKGRVLIMEFEVAAFAVHAQDEGRDPPQLRKLFQ